MVYKVRFRRGLRPQTTKFDRVLTYIGVCLLLLFSFVLLIPFHLAAGSVGGIAPAVMTLINLGIMGLGVSYMIKGWRRLTKDTTDTDTTQSAHASSRVPKVDSRD